MFRRVLAADECAVVVHKRRPPELVRGPGHVRTFQRQRRVVLVGLRPFSLETRDEDLRTQDGVPVGLELKIGAQVIDPVDAVVKAADYREATSDIVRVVARVVIGDVPHERLAGELHAIERAILERSDVEMRTFGVSVSSVRCTVHP